MINHILKNEYFADVDSELTYSYSGNNKIKITLVGNNISFSGEKNFFGEEEITIKVSDSEYEISQKLKVKVNPVNDLPSVEINSPKNNEKVSGTIKIEGIAKDVDSTIQKVEIKIDGGEWKDVEVKENWQYELNTNDLANGEHTIAVRVFDGISYSESSINIIVENQKTEGKSFIPFVEFGIILVLLSIIAVIRMKTLFLLTKKR